MENMFSNDPSRPADTRDKRLQRGLAESVSDNCSITCPIGQLVCKSGLPKMSAKKCIKLEVIYDECDCVVESGQ